MRKIRIEIDELVLHGFEYHDHRRIEAAVVWELGRLVKQNGLTQDRLTNKEISKMAAATSFNINGHAYPRTRGALGKAA